LRKKDGKFVKDYLELEKSAYKTVVGNILSDRFEAYDGKGELKSYDVYINDIIQGYAPGNLGNLSKEEAIGELLRDKFKEDDTFESYDERINDTIYDYVPENFYKIS
jgi:hypothetical protein